MGKYDAWDRFFAELEGDRVRLDLDRFEQLTGMSLPPSARRYPEWWSKAQYYAVWDRHGWRATPKLGSNEVVFTRSHETRTEPRPRPAVSQAKQTQPSAIEADMLLVGCVAQKAAQPTAARDLYTSPLWRKRRGYADHTGKPWFILSAEHGLVSPDEQIGPYDRALARETSEYRRTWSERTAQQVIERARSLGARTIEIHAGAAYAENGLLRVLGQSGFRVDWPLRGKRIGEQLSWYDAQTSQLPPNPTSQPDSFQGTIRASEPSTHQPRIAITDMKAAGAWQYRWPEETQSFDRGWVGKFEHAGELRSFRHALGTGTTYGADRVRSATFIDGSPVVEGVAADDYELSRGLVSLLKAADGTMVRRVAEAPAGYEPLVLVEHRIEIDAPYSRRGLAVKIREDDVAGWLLHAILRSELRAASGGSDENDSPTAIEDHEVVPPSPADQQAIGAAMIAHKPPDDPIPSPESEGGFTANPAANELLHTDPWAFLVAVICDYQIKAERAWEVPYLLRQRIGHLEPQRMLDDADAVIAAFEQRPALHRYVKRVPAFLLGAAEIVLDEYGGDAGAIWDDQPTAEELRRRLEEFPGISQKKAAMAVEILERDIGVEIRDMYGSDIAYDVHVRRVFLRTGLAEYDDVNHMVSAARRLNPHRPGALDLPAWDIGRRWCRPRQPLCDECVIGDVCPRLVERGDHVRGA